MPQPAPADLPDAFRAPRALRWLNIAAVGFSLAAATGVVFGMLLDRGVDNGESSPRFALACSVSTLVIGLVWAWLIRVRLNSMPVGWVAAIPLAAINAGVALTLVSMGPGPLSTVASLHSVASTFALGAVLGVIAWGPALVVTLVLYGVPLYLAQRAADLGLSSEDRGERNVAHVTVAISAVALLASLLVKCSMLEHAWLGVLGAVGMATGARAASYATRRQANRHRFLTDVARGEVEGFHIDAQAALLVRVRMPEAGGDYRTARIAEPVAELDLLGRAKRTLERG